MPNRCQSCDYTPTTQPTSDRPFLITLLRGDADPVVTCTYCLLTVLAREVAWDGQATVFLSEQYAPAPR